LFVVLDTYFSNLLTTNFENTPRKKRKKIKINKAIIISEILIPDTPSFHTSTNKFLKFFYSSRLHFIIILEVSIGKMKSFETLCQKIPNAIGKRTTIQTILNEAVAMNLMIKYPCAKDRRIKFYKLTKDSEQMINEWAKFKY